MPERAEGRDCDHAQLPSSHADFHFPYIVHLLMEGPSQLIEAREEGERHPPARNENVTMLLC